MSCREDLAAVLRVDEPRADLYGRRGRPRHLVAAIPREPACAMQGIGGVGGVADERDALVGAEVVTDLDVEAILIALDHLRVERCRPGADAAQRRQVDRCEQRLVLQQHVEHRRRCDGVLRTLGGDLLEEGRQVERMVQQQGSAGVQPTHEAAAERRHIDQRKGVKERLARLYPGAAQVRPADRPPVVVRARHALGGAFRARGPADRRDVVGVDAERGAVRRQCSPPRVIRRRGGEGDGAFRERVPARRAAQTEHA